MPTSEMVLHLGAHRTGTTSLQAYLRANSEMLRARGVEFFTPRELRADADVRYYGMPRCILSEENIIGSMRNNMARGTLYSDVADRLLRHPVLLEQTTTIVLSVRDLADWWRSAILFTVNRANRPIKVPSPADLLRISQRSRGWMQVAEDIHRAAPHARLVVRDFAWRTANPALFLTRATGWDVFGDTVIDTSKGNTAPNVKGLRNALSGRQDFENLERLDKLDRNMLFAPDSVEHMRNQFRRDLQDLRASEFVTFLGVASKQDA